MNVLKDSKNKNNSPTEILRNNLRRLMRRKDVSEAELVRQTQAPQTTINKILTGETSDPRISTLKMFAEYFDVTVDDLYIENNEFIAPKTQKAQPIPILSWTNCIKGSKFIHSLDSSNWEEWMVIEPITKYTYGLISKPSMEPRFPRETILIISPETTPTDGDLVVVHYKETQEATLRELIFNGKNKLLVPFNEKSTTAGELISNEVSILGVLMAAKLSYHK